MATTKKAKKKVSKKTAKRKVTAKKPAKKVNKKVAKKTASKKKITKKATSKKKVTKKKVGKKSAIKKTSKKKVAKKKTPTKKKPVTKKTATKKKPTTKKSAVKIAPPKSRSKKRVSVKKTSTAKAGKPKTVEIKPKQTASVPTKVAVAKTRAVKPEKRKKNKDALKPSSTGSIHGIDSYKPQRGEEYMNSEMHEHFKHILNAWKRELMVEVDRTMDHMQDDAANFPDPSDRATQESEFSLELRTRDRERKLLKKINSALEDISTGDYGYCEACGIEIGLRRLEARPTADLCIDCKTLDEIREKQRGK